MLPYLLAAALGTPAPCPDPQVTNPRLKIVRSVRPGYDRSIVTVDVTNRGTEQRTGIEQRLELERDGVAAGSQPVPALGAQQTYTAAFRLEVPHAARRRPLRLTIRYVLAGGGGARENCDAGNDVLTVTL